MAMPHCLSFLGLFLTTLSFTFLHFTAPLCGSTGPATSCPLRCKQLRPDTTGIDSQCRAVSMIKVGFPEAQVPSAHVLLHWAIFPACTQILVAAVFGSHVYLVLVLVLSAMPQEAASQYESILSFDADALALRSWRVSFHCGAFMDLAGFGCAIFPENLRSFLIPRFLRTFAPFWCRTGPCT